MSAWPPRRFGWPAVWTAAGSGYAGLLREIEQDGPREVRAYCLRCTNRGTVGDVVALLSCGASGSVESQSLLEGHRHGDTRPIFPCRRARS